ncbi:MAG: hypothetical protein WHT82_12360, partial [Limisphaera sp.]
LVVKTFVSAAAEETAAWLSLAPGSHDLSQLGLTGLSEAQRQGWLSAHALPRMGRARPAQVVPNAPQTP